MFLTKNKGGTVGDLAPTHYHMTCEGRKCATRFPDRLPLTELKQWYHLPGFTTKSAWWEKKVKAGDVFYYLEAHNFPVFLIKLNLPLEKTDWDSCRRNFDTNVVWIPHHVEC